MGYTNDVIRGVSWIGLLKFSTKLIGFLEVIIIAKILLPAQFGAYGIALLSLGLLETITETGVNIVLIQEDNIDELISSAWVVSIVRGALIAAVLFLSAPFVSAFFHSPESLNLLYLISIAPLVRGFINPSVVKFQKELRFGSNFYYQFAILAIDTVVAVLVTYVTKSPIGIAVGLLAGALFELFASFIVISPKPSLNYKPEYVRMIFRRGKWVTASSIFDYLFNNTDNIAVGKILGTTFLGIYQLAYSLSVVPLSEVGKVFVHVTVPIFVRISGDQNRLKAAFLSSVLSVFIICIPFVVVLVVFPQLFELILGKKWAGVTSVLPILAAVGLVRALSLSSSAVFLSVRKQNYITIVTLVTILGFAVSIVPLVVNLGIKGAGFSGLISSLLAVPFIIFFLIKVFEEINKQKPTSL